MRLHHVLLLTLVIVITICGGIAAAESDLLEDGRFRGVNGARLLRDADSKSPNAEERGITSYISHGVKIRLTKWRVNSWVNAKKSDDYVLKTLGIDKLAGAALKNHKNYKTFEKFRVARWLKKDTPTSTVWDDVGLAAVSEANRETAEGFGTYVKYLLAYDAKFWKYWKGDTLKEMKIVGGGSVKEMKAKSSILTLMGRDELYINAMLHGMH